jgi:hypothetical protein
MSNHREINKSYQLKCISDNFGFTLGKVYRTFIDNNLMILGRIGIISDTGRIYQFKVPKVYEYFEQI